MNANLQEDLQSHLVASILENDETFNRTVRKHLDAYRAGRISLVRFTQLRNNARGNTLQAHRLPQP